MELNKIYNEDCFSGMERMKQKGIKANLIVTDPPFAFAGGISNGGASMADDQFFYHWLKDLFRLMLDVSTVESAWFVYGDWRSMYLYQKALQEIQPTQKYEVKKLSQVIVHNREMIGMGKPFRNQYELIGYIKGSKTDYSNIPNNTPNIINSYWYYGKHKHHPAEKDVKIFKQLIEWGSNEGDLVFDPFSGGGTTALAAIEANRNYIGFEIEQKFNDVAERRVDERTKPQLY